MAKVLHSLDEKHSLYQDTDGFLFGTDAVLLSAFIRPRKGSVGVELGTGTGIIPILLSIHKEFKKIYALEIQEDYVSLARENLALNGFSDKVEVICGDLKNAESLVPFPCDFVFSNPPYRKKDSGKGADGEKKRIARHEIYCDISDVCRAASSLLEDKGEFYCIYPVCRLSELFCAMHRVRLEPKNMILVCATKEKEPGLVLVRGVKGAKPDLKTRVPFVIQEKDGSKTQECRLLYQTGILDYGRGK